MARKPEGWRLVAKLAGSERAKTRVEEMLKTMSGESTIEESSARLAIAPSLFHRLRQRALEEMVKSLEPRKPGPKPSEPDVAALERENEELGRRVKDLERDIAKSRVREEAARWGGSGGKRWGKRRAK